MQQDFLVFAGLGDAPFADFDAFTRWQHYVHHAQFFKLLKNTTRFIAKARFVAQAGQRLPEHVGQKTDQNVSQHAVFLLVPNRTDAQITFINAGNGFRFGELNVSIPQLLIAPVDDVASQQIATFAEFGPVSPGIDLFSDDFGPAIGALPDVDIEQAGSSRVFSQQFADRHWLVLTFLATRLNLDKPLFEARVHRLFFLTTIADTAEDKYFFVAVGSGTQLDFQFLTNCMPVLAE